MTEDLVLELEINTKLAEADFTKLLKRLDAKAAKSTFLGGGKGGGKAGGKGAAFSDIGLGKALIDARKNAPSIQRILSKISKSSIKDLADLGASQKKHFETLKRLSRDGSEAQKRDAASLVKKLQANNRLIEQGTKARIRRELTASKTAKRQELAAEQNLQKAKLAAQQQTERLRVRAAARNRTLQIRASELGARGQAPNAASQRAFLIGAARGRGGRGRGGRGGRGGAGGAGFGQASFQLFQVQQAIEDFQFAGIRGAANNISVLAASMAGPTGLVAVSALLGVNLLVTAGAFKKFGEAAKKAAQEAKRSIAEGVRLAKISSGIRIEKAGQAPGVKRAFGEAFERPGIKARRDVTRQAFQRLGAQQAGPLQRFLAGRIKADPKKFAGETAQGAQLSQLEFQQVQRKEDLAANKKRIGLIENLIKASDAAGEAEQNRILTVRGSSARRREKLERKVTEANDKFQAARRKVLRGIPRFTKDFQKVKGEPFFGEAASLREKERLKRIGTTDTAKSILKKLKAREVEFKDQIADVQERISETTRVAGAPKTAAQSAQEVLTRALDDNRSLQLVISEFQGRPGTPGRKLGDELQRQVKIVKLLNEGFDLSRASVDATAKGIERQRLAHERLVESKTEELEKLNDQNLTEEEITKAREAAATAVTKSAVALERAEEAAKKLEELEKKREAHAREIERAAKSELSAVKSLIGEKSRLIETEKRRIEAISQSRVSNRDSFESNAFGVRRTQVRRLLERIGAPERFIQQQENKLIAQQGKRLFAQAGATTDLERRIKLLQELQNLQFGVAANAQTPGRSNAALRGAFKTQELIQQTFDKQKKAAQDTIATLEQAKNQAGQLSGFLQQAAAVKIDPLAPGAERRMQQMVSQLKQFNAQIKAAGGKGIAAPKLGFAGGGKVPGAGRGDKQLIRATAGEFVLQESAVKALGLPVVNQLNQFAHGGEVMRGSAGLREMQFHQSRQRFRGLPGPGDLTPQARRAVDAAVVRRREQLREQAIANRTRRQVARERRRADLQERAEKRRDALKARREARQQEFSGRGRSQRALARRKARQARIAARKQARRGRQLPGVGFLPGVNLPGGGGGGGGGGNLFGQGASGFSGVGGFDPGIVNFITQEQARAQRDAFAQQRLNILGPQRSKKTFSLTGFGRDATNAGIQRQKRRASRSRFGGGIFGEKEKSSGIFGFQQGGLVGLPSRVGGGGGNPLTRLGGGSLSSRFGVGMSGGSPSSSVSGGSISPQFAGFPQASGGFGGIRQRIGALNVTIQNPTEVGDVVAAVARLDRSRRLRMGQP